MIGSNKDSWMVVRSTSDSKKKHALSKTYLNPFGPWQALPTLEPPDHRCLFAMFVLWESVGYWCLLYLHFVLGGECFWRADSHEKGSLLHRQVSGFFKVARYWLPDHWQDWVGSSIFSKQKNISIEKIDLAWSWPTATQSEKSTITLNSGSAINYLQPSGFERCRRCHWSNAHGFPRVDSKTQEFRSLDFFKKRPLTLDNAQSSCESLLRMGAAKVLHSQLGIQGLRLGWNHIDFSTRLEPPNFLSRSMMMKEIQMCFDAKIPSRCGLHTYIYNHGLLSTPLRRIWILHPGDQTAIGVELLKPKLVLQSKSTEPLMSSLNVFWTGCNSIFCFLSC